MAPDEVDLCRDLAQMPSIGQRLMSKGGSVGYGANEFLDVVAPYALIGAGWMGSVILDEAKQQTEKRLRTLTKRLFGTAGVKKLDRRLQNKAIDPQEQLTLLLVELGLAEPKARRLAKELTTKAKKGQR